MCLVWRTAAAGWVSHWPVVDLSPFSSSTYSCCWFLGLCVSKMQLFSKQKSDSSPVNIHAKGFGFEEIYWLTCGYWYDLTLVEITGISLLLQSLLQLLLLYEFMILEAYYWLGQYPALSILHWCGNCYTLAFVILWPESFSVEVTKISRSYSEKKIFRRQLWRMYH